MALKTSLVRLWIGFSTFTTVLSIASLLDDILVWVGFVRRMIAAYRGLVDPVWGTILALLPWHAPRWTHDYFTVTSLMAVSVLWALHSTGTTFGFSALGSLVGAVRNSALDFKIGGNTFELFAKAANEAIVELGDAQIAARAAVGQVTRPTVNGAGVIDGLLTALGLVLGGVLLPILVPPMMEHADHAAFHRANALFARRRRELQVATLSDQARDRLLAAFDASVETYQGWNAINRDYHAEIRRQILNYYIAVALGFGALVFANYLALRLPGIAKAFEAPQPS